MSSSHKDFIREIVARDRQAGKHGGIVRTRFPPEPNGYLHIGHAKAICADFGVADGFDGTCNLRMDDTDPHGESQEYVDAIARDVRWLGFDWEGSIRYASDYFERYYQTARRLIQDGLAYVDSSSEEEIREMRGTVTEPGQPSPYRDRSIEENLALFTAMREGEFEKGEHVLRARIDMAADNMKFRDPILYRIDHTPHYRTQEEWPIYPMYDWAHPLGDAFEGITHSFCTLEFEENRPLYDWVIEHTRPEPQAPMGSWEPRPRQYEFSRLNLDYTIMSKRKLAQLVEAGDVEGWGDPRMPTLAGLRRRGVPPEALRRFIEDVGLSKAQQNVQVAKLEHVLRDELNTEAPRAMAVLDPLKVVITNYPDDQTEDLDVPVYPREIDKEETRTVPFERTIYIERDDFRVDPPEGYHRLAPGREVRLRHAYFITCDEVVRDENGEVEKLLCSYDPDTRGGKAPDGRSPAGTLHWVPAHRSHKARVHLYDRLFEEPAPGQQGPDFREALNPESLVVKPEARIEPGIADEDTTRYQFYRQGYFFQDPEAEELSFNQIVALRDSWSRKRDEQAPGPEEGKKQEEIPPEQQKGATHVRQIPEEHQQVRQEHPHLQERFTNYQEQLSLDEETADLLTSDPRLSGWFEALRDHGTPVEAAANWLIHELRPRLSGRSWADLPFAPENLASLIELRTNDTLVMPAAREVLEEMLESGAAPSAIVERRGLEAITTREKLKPFVERLLEAHPQKVEQFRGGNKGLLQFFMGQIMRETEGRADPQMARDLLKQALKPSSPGQGRSR